MGETGTVIPGAHARSLDKMSVDETITAMNAGEAAVTGRPLMFPFWFPHVSRAVSISEFGKWLVSNPLQKGF